MSSLNYFETVAPQWNVMRADYFDETLRSKMIPRAQLSGKVVADLGAGTGFLSLALAQDAQLVFAVDQSRNMLGELSRSAAGQSLNNVYPILGTFEALPLYDTSVDHIFSSMALHHVENPQLAIKEMYRVLKPGGAVYLADVEAHDGHWAIEEMHDVWLGFEKAQLKKWFEDAGFKMLQVSQTGLSCKGYSQKGEFTEAAIFLANAIK